MTVLADEQGSREGAAEADHRADPHPEGQTVDERMRRIGAGAEAWIFISLGLLSTIDRRLGTVGDRDFEGVFASRRRWMLGENGA